MNISWFLLDSLSNSLFAQVFDIFDCDKSGTIDQKELFQMIISTSELIGKSCEKQYAQNLAKKILDSCDTNRNGRITKEEFIIG